MLTKRYRLVFSDTQGRRGRTIHHLSVLVKAFPAEFPYSRFTVVLGKSVAKKATERNKFKRAIWAFIEKHHQELPLHDYVFIVLPSIKSKTRDGLIEELERGLLS